MTTQPQGVKTKLSPNWEKRPTTQLEFTLAILTNAPSAKVALKQQPSRATRDFATIEQWVLTRWPDLIFDGIRLKE